MFKKNLEFLVHPPATNVRGCIRRSLRGRHLICTWFTDSCTIQLHMPQKSSSKAVPPELKVFFLKPNHLKVGFVCNQGNSTRLRNKKNPSSTWKQKHFGRMGEQNFTLLSYNVFVPSPSSFDKVVVLSLTRVVCTPVRC